MIREYPATTPVKARPAYRLPTEARPRLEAPGRPALEPGREIDLHLHGLTPGQLAAILRHSIEEKYLWADGACNA